MQEAVILNPYLESFQAGLPLATRKSMIWAYSWAVPSLEAIRSIQDLSPLLELGAGTGYWAWLLKQAGCDVIGMDQRVEAPPHWTAVEKGTPKDLERFPDRSLLLVWPPLADRADTCMAYQALNHWRGSQLAYVGEWRGRTASPSFHDRLERNFEKTLELPIPRWEGFSDSLFLFKSLQ